MGRGFWGPRSGPVPIDLVVISADSLDPKEVGVLLRDFEVI